MTHVPRSFKICSIQALFLDFIDDLAGLLVRSQDDDLRIEVLGILASLRIPDVSTSLSCYNDSHFLQQFYFLPLLYLILFL